jgi:hypothetical protein
MSNQILENYEFGEIKDYLFFLESTVPFDNGVFYSFDTEEELLAVIRDEILIYCGVEEDELEEFQNELDELLPSSIDEIDPEVINQINQLLPSWKIAFVGSLDDLMNNDGEVEQSVRKQFREYANRDEGSDPIEIEELDEFKIFLLPE